VKNKKRISDMAVRVNKKIRIPFLDFKVLLLRMYLRAKTETGSCGDV
jgi:hypothetical protein